MKVIQAFWEQRNLGVECNEFVIDKSDSLTTVEKILNEYQCEYSVIKVPVARTDIMFYLSGQGYHFIETSMHVTHDLREITLNSLQKRFNDAVSYVKMTDNDIISLFQKISEGIFLTDRIALDPFFSIQDAAKRYIGWISDELEKGCDIYKLILKDREMGFFTFKHLGDGVYFPFLTGLYPDVNAAGLGFTVIYKAIEETIRRNGKQISTYISTNNSSIVHLLSLLQFKFGEMHYVYIKHQMKD